MVSAVAYPRSPLCHSRKDAPPRRSSFSCSSSYFWGGGWLWGNWSGRKSDPANVDTASNPLPIPLPLGDRLKGDPLKIDDTELTLPSGVD
ncbi:MAG: hypothetical protein HC799_19855 [Limnothrix sp. RL_2_0]|nr:hypothetical protein [Limnothrix sp. RL_2_0]